MLYPSPIQLSHVYGPIAHWVLQGGPKSEWRNTSFRDYEPPTVSVFLSVVRCGRVCREQTYTHSGIEPSRSAKGFLQGGPKNSLKKRIFDHLQTLRISATAKNRAIQQRTYLFTVPVPFVETPWNLCPWESYVECEWRVYVSSTDALVCCSFCLICALIAVCNRILRILLVIVAPATVTQRVSYWFHLCALSWLFGIIVRVLLNVFNVSWHWMVSVFFFYRFPSSLPLPSLPLLSPALPSPSPISCPPFLLLLSPPNAASDLGERCKHPQRGPGRSPGRKRILHLF